MLNGYFYHGTLHKYVVIFGALFNNITIKKRLQNNTEVATIKVPIAYGPAAKFLARLDADPTLDHPVAISLPRMSFELTGMIYAGDRKLPTLGRFGGPSANATVSSTMWNPVPYDMNFSLKIITKSYEDGSAIVEQILPYFTPAWTSTVQLLDDPVTSMDVPLILIGVSNQDNYDSDFKERRELIWSLDFVMKGFFFGPVRPKKLIKIANTNLFTALTANTAATTISIRPGLTANGMPTSNSALSIPALDIGSSDDWDYIVQITDA